MDADRPLLLHQPDHVVGVVDYLGRPVARSSSGGWISAAFIIVVELAERLAYYSISLNLITYLTGPLQQSTASAAAAVNAWNGVAYMLPFLGAFLAESYLGRYRTIVVASLVYFLALGMLTMSTVLPTLYPPDCGGDLAASSDCKPSSFQMVFFYLCLYVIAFAQAGHKSCVQAFGADQFDQSDPREFFYRLSFFNWWNVGVYGGMLLASSVLTYVQDNISWTLGFAMPCMFLLFALLIFLLGTKTYRFFPVQDENPFDCTLKTLLALASKKGKLLCNSTKEDIERHRFKSHSISLSTEDDDHNHIDGAEGAEEVKGLLQLPPIWASCLIYAVVLSQPSTLFTKQSTTLDRTIGKNFQVPAATGQSISYGSIVILIPIYDRFFVPMVRRFTKLPSGITMLQRIGIGLFLSVVEMAIAALVEMKRLRTARDFGLVDQPDAVIPMSLWWMFPQYFLHGASQIFTAIGMQELFYDQVPDTLRSFGLAFNLSVYGVGEFISSILVSTIDGATRRAGESWFSNNLNLGHLDYFYWLLAALSASSLLMYLYLAHTFHYKKAG